MTALTIRCLDCPKSEHITWLPLTWPATCLECAQTSVTNHLTQHPTHRCEVLPNEPPPPPAAPVSTLRLTKRHGW